MRGLTRVGNIAHRGLMRDGGAGAQAYTLDDVEGVKPMLRAPKAEGLAGAGPTRSRLLASRFHPNHLLGSNTRPLRTRVMSGTWRAAAMDKHV